jgi:hypothetical protein
VCPIYFRDGWASGHVVGGFAASCSGFRWCPFLGFWLLLILRALVAVLRVSVADLPVLRVLVASDS